MTSGPAGSNASDKASRITPASPPLVGEHNQQRFLDVVEYDATLPCCAGEGGEIVVGLAHYLTQTLFVQGLDGLAGEDLISIKSQLPADGRGAWVQSGCELVGV